MKKLNVLTAVTALTLALAFTPMAAQADGVNGRLENQRDRIQQGVRNGELTRRETNIVRTDDRSIRTDERFDRRADQGKLTDSDRFHLDIRLARNSDRIYDLKHNCDRR